jgi:hypothetical protein
MSLELADYHCAAAAVGYAKITVEGKTDHFNHLALKEILRWVVLPASGKREEPRMYSELFARAEGVVTAREFMRGLDDPQRMPPPLRVVSGAALFEFARLVREEAFNEYRAQNEQAVRP